jgi:hypothetical protein
MNLIPSLAFTALLELHPTYAQMDVADPRGKALLRALTEEMKTAFYQGNQNLWEFATAWINEHP